MKHSIFAGGPSAGSPLQEFKVAISRNKVLRSDCVQRDTKFGIPNIWPHPDGPEGPTSEVAKLNDETHKTIAPASSLPQYHERNSRRIKPFGGERKDAARYRSKKIQCIQ